MSAIEAIGLTKQYRDTTAVDALTLSIEEGELFGLLGVNGAGKTTTVKMLSCLTSPTAGDALLLGKSILTDAAAIKEMIAVSPQETAVAPALSVRENLALMCGVHGLSKKQSEERIASLVSLLGLSAVERKRAGKLSGGFCRRLSIAMALISKPRILFLDEPTLGLDVIARSELWDLIRALKTRATIVLTTHYMEEAEALCDRVAIMKDGRLLTCDSPAAIREKTGEGSLEAAFLRIVRGDMP